jgi:hypothetical protein
VKSPQLAQFSAHPGPMSALFLADSLTRIPVVALKKIRRLSRFLPLIVLIPRSRFVKDHGLPPQDRGQQVPQPELEGRESAWPARQICGAIQNHKHEEPVCVRRRQSQFLNQGIRRQGQPVEHAMMESKTLKYMIRNERRVISSDELLNEVWRYAYRRQTHLKVAARTRTGTVEATTLPNRPPDWLQVLALARSTLTTGGHARGFHGSPWRC